MKKQDEGARMKDENGRRRRHALVSAAIFQASILFLIGCAPYTQVEIDLAAQTKKGLSLIRAAQADHTALAGRVNELQRQRLDDAFDNDVRDAADLSPDWVIEHRKAYSVGVDALGTQRAASSNAAATATRNIEAIEQSITQLQRLQKARLRLEQNINLETDK